MITTTATNPDYRRGRSALPDLVSAIGSNKFGAQLQDYLYSVCGADHCTVFQLGADSVSEVVSGSFDGTDIAHRRASTYVTKQYWRKDPAMSEAKRCGDRISPMVIKVDICGLADHDLRQTIYPHIRQRLLVAGRNHDTAFGLSILRSEGGAAFSEDDIHEVEKVSELLVALLSKHVEVTLRTSRMATALSSLREIEACISNTADLPRREMQICARILYGLSTTGIALDLAVGPESVKTYRKRVYQRLQIGCERQLLTWYLALWALWQENCHPVSTERLH